MRRAVLFTCAVAALGACGGSLQPERATEDAGIAARGSSPDSGTSSGSSGGDGAPSLDAGPTDDAAQFDAGVDAGGTDAATADAGTSMLGPSCPVLQPNDGDSCSPVDWICEYGDSPDPYCDDYERCYSIGGWSNEALPVALCGKGTCPASFASVPVGQACSMQNLDCAYPEGQCDCGRADDAGPLVWSCFDPPGCPEPRPRLGSYCPMDGLYCDYGACAGGVAEKCVIQLGWMQVFPACSYDGGL